MLKKIIEELKHHVPFTAFGALTGILLMFLFRNISGISAHRLFYVFHPLHVVLSAIVTVAMYKTYKCRQADGKCSLWKVFLIGYFGSIGIATLSDSFIPYLGEAFFKLPNAHVHIGFIEEWWLVNPAAIVGIIIGYLWTKTKIPHAGHVLLSTWASLFHVLMALGSVVSLYVYSGIFIFLFLSVWVPCCVSDIVFPLLFVNGSGNKEKTRGCC